MPREYLSQVLGRGADGLKSLFGKIQEGLAGWQPPEAEHRPSPKGEDVDGKW